MGTFLRRAGGDPDSYGVRCRPVRPLVGPSRAESGNVSYDLHRLKNNPAAFYVLANWRDQAAFDQHVASGHVRTLLNEQTAPDLVAAPMLSCARPLSSPDTRPDRPRATANSPAQVALVPFFASEPGAVDEVRRAHLMMVEPTRAEHGCLDYDLYQSGRTRR